MSIVPQRLPDVENVRLWLVTGPASEDERASLDLLLSPDEIERRDRFKVEFARHDFVVSRGSLRRLLASELGRALEELQFGRGKHGKPFLKGAHTDLHFNVSHSGDLFLYALSDRPDLGVDVEFMKPDRELERIAERFFAPGEVQRLLKDGRREDSSANFYRCWTRKEAYLKAKGLGITMQLDAFEVTFLPGEDPRLLHTEVEGEDPAAWRLVNIPVPAAYQAALVYPRTTQPTGER